MRIFAFAVAAVSLLAAPAFATETFCKGNEKNLNTYLQMHKVLFMDRDSSRVGEFYAPEIKSHNNDAGGPGSMVKNSHLAAMWDRSKKYDPERVLDADARQATSGFARMPPAVVERVVGAVGADLASGAWDRRHGRLRALQDYDVGLRLIVAEKT